MFDPSPQESESTSSREEFKVSSAPRQVSQSRKRMRDTLGRHGFHGKRRANVRSRVDNEATSGLPCRICRVVADKDSGGTAIDRYLEKARHAVIVYSRSDRSAIRRPGRRALQLE